MENHFITLQVSAEKYWGFLYKVPIEYANNIDKDILVKELKTYMENFFHFHNLLELKDGVKELKLSIESIVSPITYVCNHCHCDHDSKE